MEKASFPHVVKEEEVLPNAATQTGNRAKYSLAREAARCSTASLFA